MSFISATGYSSVNGVEMYWERRGSGDNPLVVVHGGFGLASMEAELLDKLAGQRQVLAVEPQGHGHTKDVDRPFSYEAFGDDLGQLIEDLDLGRVDLLGYSLGGGASLRCAIQYPDRVSRLALVSTAFRSDAWFPEILTAFEKMSSAGFEMMRQTPLYAAWCEVAPDPDAFPSLMDKTGEIQRRPYDWSGEVKKLMMPVLLVFADADSIPPSHAVEFFALLGGGLKDGGWDGSDGVASHLAILAGLTHYNIFSSPQLVPVVEEFLG